MVGSVCFSISLLGIVLGASKVFGLKKELAFRNDIADLRDVGNLHVWKRLQNGVTDYPTSMNRDDYINYTNSVPAGYTLGSITTGSFQITPTGSMGGDTTALATYNISDTLYVYSDGKVKDYQYWATASIDRYSYKENIIDNFCGKFIKLYSYSSSFTSIFTEGDIIYIPSDATFIQSGYSWYVDKYQTVNTYPQTEETSSINYLGIIGKKGFHIFGKYTGVGTMASSDNPKVLNIGVDASSFDVIIIRTDKYPIYENSLDGYNISNNSITYMPDDYNLSNRVIYFENNKLYWYVTNNRNAYTSLDAMDCIYYYHVIKYM